MAWDGLGRRCGMVRHGGLGWEDDTDAVRLSLFACMPACGIDSSTDRSFLLGRLGLGKRWGLIRHL
jgi:hypothetical protein